MLDYTFIPSGVVGHYDAVVEAVPGDANFASASLIPPPPPPLSTLSDVVGESKDVLMSVMDPLNAVIDAILPSSCDDTTAAHAYDSLYHLAEAGAHRSAAFDWEISATMDVSGARALPITDVFRTVQKDGQAGEDSSVRSLHREYWRSYQDGAYVEPLQALPHLRPPLPPSRRLVHATGTTGLAGTTVAEGDASDYAGSYAGGVVAGADNYPLLSDRSDRSDDDSETFEGIDGAKPSADIGAPRKPGILTAAAAARAFAAALLARNPPAAISSTAISDAALEALSMAAESRREERIAQVRDVGLGLATALADSDLYDLLLSHSVGAAAEAAPTSALPEEQKEEKDQEGGWATAVHPSSASITAGESPVPALPSPAAPLDVDGVLGMLDMALASTPEELAAASQASEAAARALAGGSAQSPQLPAALSPENILSLARDAGTSRTQHAKKRWVILQAAAPPSVEDFHRAVPSPAMHFPFTLDAFQRESIMAMEGSSGDILVSARTSAGKTVMAEYAIASVLAHRTRAIYTSPVKALSNQKYRDFSLKFGKGAVGLLTGDVAVETCAPALVMTTEILRSMLYRNDEMLSDVEWVIFDEVHYIADRQRGHVWEESLIMLPKHVRLVLLSATAPNRVDFAEWVGSVRQSPIHVIASVKRPVPLEFYLMWRKSKEVLIADSSGKWDGEAYETLAKKIAHDAASSRAPPKTGPGADRGGWHNILRRLQSLDLLPAVCFVFARRRCDEIARYLSSFDLLQSSQRARVLRIVRASIRQLAPEDRVLPQVQLLEMYAMRGIAIHHAGLLPIVKEVVEELFSCGLLKVLIATETFALGVNAPARSVVFPCLTKWSGGSGQRPLTAGEFIQMSGRAGRRGLDIKGTVFFAPLRASDVPTAGAAKLLMTGDAEPLVSRFRLTNQIILSLSRSAGIGGSLEMQAKRMQVADVMRRSLSEAASTQIEPLQRLALAAGEVALSSNDERLSVPAGQCPFGKHEAMSVYHDAFSKWITAARLVSGTIASSAAPPTAITCTGRVVVLSVDNWTAGARTIAALLHMDQRAPGRWVFAALPLADAQSVAHLPPSGLHGLPCWHAGMLAQGNVASQLSLGLSAVIAWSSVVLPTSASTPRTPSDVAMQEEFGAGRGGRGSRGRGKNAGRIVKGSVAMVSTRIGGTGSGQPGLIGADEAAAATMTPFLERLWRVGLSTADGGAAVSVDVSALLDAGIELPLSWLSTAGQVVRRPELSLAEQIEARDEAFSSLISLSPEEVPCGLCTNELREAHFVSLQRRRHLEARLMRVRRVLANDALWLAPELECREALLKAVGLLSHDGAVTLKGRVACELAACDEILLTETIFEGFMSHRDPAEVAAILSVFVPQDQLQQDHQLTVRNELPPVLFMALDSIIGIAARVEEAYRTHGLAAYAGAYVIGSDNCAVRWTAMHAVYLWASGSTFLTASAATQLMPGNFVTTLMHVDIICKELRSVARILGDVSLHACLSAASDAIRRGIVLASMIVQ